MNTTSPNTKKLLTEFSTLPPLLDSLASRIAQQLEKEIIDAGWKVGEDLGTEENLVQRFGVSRWVMREALAITDRDGLTRMKRGRGGGLSVSAPARRVIVTMLRNYLLFAGIDYRGLLAMRKLLEGVAGRLAESTTEASLIAATRKLLNSFSTEKNFGAGKEVREIYDQTFALSGNRLLQIFSRVVSQLTFGLGTCLGSDHFNPERHSAYWQIMGEIRHRQLECILAGDLSGTMEAAHDAHENMLKMYIDSPFKGERFYFGDSMQYTQTIAERIVNLFPSGRQVRRVDTLVLQMRLDLLRTPPGDSVASEKSLIERYGVGRHVMREAIRILQRDHVVASTLGRNGGLYITNPDATNVVRSSVLLLKSMRIQMCEIEPISRELCAFSADLIARKDLQPSPTIDIGSTYSSAIEWLGNFCDDPIVALFTKIIAEYLRCTPSNTENSAPLERQVDPEKLIRLSHALTQRDAALSHRYAKDL